MSNFQITCLKCGRQLSIRNVWWKPLFNKDGAVTGMRVQLECACGNAEGYVDFAGDEGEEAKE